MPAITDAPSLVGHSTIGTNNIQRAASFSDSLFQTFGVGRVVNRPNAMYYGAAAPEFGILTPFNGESATVRNGTMVALHGRSRAHVRQVHELALQLGGTNEGAPGLYGEYPNGPYCAYFRDPEGNKFLVFRHGPDEGADQ